ncbi:glycosyltransferase family 2 protein [Sphingomonas sinipercae]|uniref:Glycosyltransferase family 2 protein n=1 Tax=Sphingomonas sinipercae TaxID=2714944 RepID=A0A6G7ZPS5_9SPHN|nr:glycosyltransferase [Sphingomonas sinipercae]QIL02906.1 glycosyltransferase family 2 protein [Sphingomonas sinipercae]
MTELAATLPRVPKRFYFSVRAKFVLALAVAVLWMLFSIIISRKWVATLGDLTDPIFALFAISFIAYIPGFMNAFLVTSLLLDRRPKRVKPATYPGVTVLIAAYQEEAAIEETLETIAAEDYAGPLEVLVLNDGSTDRTVEIAQEVISRLSFPPQAEVRILDFKINRGKAAVLNSGLRVAKHDLIVTIDGDSRLHPDALTDIVERLLSDPPNTVAVAGAVLVRNSRVNLLTGAQEWDYFHGIAAVKRMQSLYQGTLVAQGAFSIYRRDALVEVGGWPESVGEDIVLTWALLRQGHRVGYAEDAIVWTNAPTTFRQFARQRQRWSRGLIEAFSHHERLLFKPRLTQMFIWWNLLFLPLDIAYTFIFIPGIIAAIFFQIFWIAGPMTLAVLPLAALWNLIIYRTQSKMFHKQGLQVRHNPAGLIFYLLVYTLVMQPVCVWGYAVEIAGLRKKWGTK